MATGGTYYEGNGVIEFAERLVEDIQRIRGNSVGALGSVLGTSNADVVVQNVHKSAAELLNALKNGFSLSDSVELLNKLEAGLHTTAVMSIVSDKELEGYLSRTDELYNKIDAEEY